MAESINETITDRNARNFDKEYEELNKQIEHIKVGSQTLMLILEYVIEFVEKIENVKGNKKKGIALLLIKRVVENADLEDEDRALCMAMINNGIVGDTIDLVINAVNGKLDLEDVIETGSKCCVFILLNLFREQQRNKRLNKRRERNNRLKGSVVSNNV